MESILHRQIRAANRSPPLPPRLRGTILIFKLTPPARVKRKIVNDGALQAIPRERGLAFRASCVLSCYILWLPHSLSKQQKIGHPTTRLARDELRRGGQGMSDGRAAPPPNVCSPDLSSFPPMAKCASQKRSSSHHIYIDRYHDLGSLLNNCGIACRYRKRFKVT